MLLFEIVEESRRRHPSDVTPMFHLPLKELVDDFLFEISSDLKQPIGARSLIQYVSIFKVHGRGKWNERRFAFIFSTYYPSMEEADHHAPEESVTTKQEPDRGVSAFGHKIMADGKPQIFDNELVTALCVQYKRHKDFPTYQKICAATNDLIDAIIRKRKFHLHAPFEDIKNSIFLQLREWIDGVDPNADTKAYSYFSSCIKNAALAYVKKETNLRKRLVFTEVPMEAFKQSYVQQFDDEVRQAVSAAVADIHVRWTEEPVREAIRYIIRCIITDRVQRRMQVIRTITSGYDLTQDTAKFLIDWSCGAVRAALLDHYDSPLGPIDVIRAAEKFSFIPDIIDIVGKDKALLLVNVFAGVTIKFPSATQARKLTTYAGVFDEIAKNPTPHTVKAVATRLRTSESQVQEYFDKTGENILSGVLEDVPLYDSDHQPPTANMGE